MTTDESGQPLAPSMPPPPAAPEGWYARPDGTSAWWDGANWLTPVTPVVLPAPLDNGGSAPRPVAEAEQSASPIADAGLRTQSDDSAGGAAAGAKSLASRLAIASMALGIAGLIMVFLWSTPVGAPGSIPEWVRPYLPLWAAAVVLGHVSRRRVDGRPGLEAASSMAGLITGYIGLGFFLPLLGLADLLRPFT
jgi:hypothetical protein